MKISIATGPWFPVPAIQGGAVARLWHGLAEEFAAAGHEVTVLCRSYPGQLQTEVLNGVRYIRQGGYPQSPNIWLDLAKDFAYAASVFPTFPDADILVINDFWLPVFAAFRPQTGKIVINANRYPKKQYWLYRKASFFSAASQAILDAIVRQYPAASPKIKVIPNPINVETFSPSPERKKSEQEKTILFVGRIHPEKGVHLLVDAFRLLAKEISSVKLRVIGPYKEEQGGGGEKYLQQLKIRAKSLQVDFVDPIFEPEKLADAYRQGDLFCYPSLAEKGESFGVAPLEAMATGMVPVVSDLDCFKDFIVQGKTGFFFDHRGPQATEHLTATLNYCLNHLEDMEQIAAQAHQVALNYGYEQVAKLYLEQFQSLINLSPAQREVSLSTHS